MNKDLKRRIIEFKNVSNIEAITKLMEQNGGYITSKLVTDLELGRENLSIMVKKGLIEKVARGIYMDIRNVEDSYYILNLELPNIIYSHMTSLYFLGISPKAPFEEYDITVYKNYYNYKIKKHNVFYSPNEVLNLGLTELKTPNGNLVKGYDMERSICDIIHSSSRIDHDLIKRAVKKYLKRKDKDLLKLSFYAEKLGSKEKIMNFIEMIYE